MTWSVLNYSTTPASNGAINGVNISEGCNASNINDAIRQMMADIASLLSTGGFIQSGSIVAHAGSSAPSGFLLCDGSAVSRTTYATLFGVLGTTYGSGDGSTTFNTPDLRGRVVAGVDGGAGRLGTGAAGGFTAIANLAVAGGEQYHVITIPELAQHIHGITDPGHVHTVTDPGHAHTVPNMVTNIGGSNGINGAGGTVTTVTATTSGNPSNITLNSATTGVSTQTTGNANAHNNVQPTMVLNYVVKT